MGAEMLAHLRRLFAYDDWANREALASLTAATAPTPRSRGLLGHVIGAEWLWMARLRDDSRSAVVWPELDLQACESQISALSGEWRAYLERLRPDDLDRPIAYTNSQGERWTNRVEDILLHVVLHSAYHRGQIAADVRASGATPAYTDFIHAVRRRFIE